MHVEAGTVITERTLTTVTGDTVLLPDARNVIHLQFRRFAGCPICHLHLRSIVLRHDEIVAQGIREVVLFHSSADELRPHTADLPFAVVGDPDRLLYTEFGVESAPRALLNPGAWSAMARGLARDTGPVLLGRAPVPRPGSGRLGLPADFLIAGDGRVLAAKYGEHADDQWSVDELLANARSTQPSR
jgi:peroxiredoxin